MLLKLFLHGLQLCSMECYRDRDLHAEHIQQLLPISDYRQELLSDRMLQLLFMALMIVLKYGLSEDSVTTH